MTTDVRILRSGDEALLLGTAPEVFDEPVDPALTRDFLADPRHHIAVAVDAGTVVGFASAVHYIHPDKPAELWVNEVSIAPSHRRRGLAQKILATLFEHGQALGCANAWVLTNRSNGPAMALYRSLGGVDGEDAMGDDIIGYDFSLED